MIVQSMPYPAPSGGGGEITFVGYEEDGWDSANAQRVIDLSGIGLQQNDLVVAMLFIQKPEADDNLQPVTSGYTQQVERYEVTPTNSQDLSFGVFTKKMGASPDSSITIQATSASGGNDKWWQVKVSAWRGVHTTTPMDVAAVHNGDDLSGNAVSPAITPVTSGAMVVDMAAACDGNGLNVLDMANPGSYDPFEMSKYGKGVSCMGAKLWPGSGAMGPHTHGGTTGGVSCWAAAQIALRPA